MNVHVRERVEVIDKKTRFFLQSGNIISPSPDICDW